METFSISSELRDITGKGPNGRLRREGRIPAVLYGHKSKSTPLTVNPKEIFKILRSSSGENTILELNVPGREKVNCLIKEYQLEPVSHELLHADFYEVAMDEMLELDVPLQTVGEPYGVKTEGGLLDLILHELRVECLPADIPAHIEIDVTNMKIGDLLRVRDLVVSDKVKILDDPETVIVAVEHPREEEVVAAPTAEAEAEPEVIKKGKAAEPGEAEEEEKEKEKGKEKGK